MTLVYATVDPAVGASLFLLQSAKRSSFDASQETGAPKLDDGTQRPAAASDIQNLQGALQTLKTLNQNGSSATSDAIKGLAMQKLALLKAELKNLMLMGGDPKQRAAEAAALGKQIAAAAQAYAQAGGDSGTSANSDAVPTQVAGSGSAASPGDPPMAAATGSAVQNDSSTTLPSPVMNAGATTLLTTLSTGGQVAPGAAQGSTASPASTAPASAPAASSGSAQMDQAFMREARRLANQAKAIIQAAEQSLKLLHRASDPAAAKAGQDAVDAVEAAANQVGDSATGGYSGSIPVPSAPAVSFLA